jgi:hypothetical protein
MPMATVLMAVPEHDPEQELREAHQGNARDFSHHELKGLHRGDDHFHDAVGLLFDHAPHHLHAVDENGNVDDERRREAHDERRPGAAVFFAVASSVRFLVSMETLVSMRSSTCVSMPARRSFTPRFPASGCVPRRFPLPC